MSEILETKKISNAKMVLDRLKGNIKRYIRGKDNVIDQIVIFLIGAWPCVNRGPAGGGKDDTGLLSVQVDCLRIRPNPIYQRSAAE